MEQGLALRGRDGQRFVLAKSRKFRLEAEFSAFRQNKPLTISAAQRQSLLHLAADLPKVWSAPTTTWTERKDLLELLIADATLTRHDTGITVQIRWFTNQIESDELPLP